MMIEGGDIARDNAKEWYYSNVQGEKHGPIGFDELRTLWENKQVRRVGAPQGRASPGPTRSLPPPHPAPGPAHVPRPTHVLVRHEPRHRPRPTRAPAHVLHLTHLLHLTHPRWPGVVRAAR